MEVWEENALSVTLFGDVLTQWRVASGGVTGLDYLAVEFVLRARGIKRRKWARLLDDVRVMEAEALRTINRK